MRAIALESERLRYQPLDSSFISQSYVDWMNDKVVNTYLQTGGNYTKEILESFLREVEKQDILFWAIVVKGNNKHIGNIKIDPVNTRFRTGEYGILLGERSEWGKGYAKEASQSIIDFCFSSTVNLRKITLGVVEDNVGAFELYKKLGFVQEGFYKKHECYNGKWCNVIRMAFFNPNINFDE
ncbi:GNAT family N-acetyltransferase [Roseivirga pacifica]|uniref:GNAT family N-acetyltransferase n=1 Tax=Roseivirga pacifica TaxID=1267423 RepID=UPI003BAE2A5D